VSTSSLKAPLISSSRRCNNERNIALFLKGWTMPSRAPRNLIVLRFFGDDRAVIRRPLPGPARTTGPINAWSRRLNAIKADCAADGDVVVSWPPTAPMIARCADDGTAGTLDGATCLRNRRHKAANKSARRFQQFLRAWPATPATGFRVCRHTTPPQLRAYSVGLRLSD